MQPSPTKPNSSREVGNPDNRQSGKLIKLTNLLVTSEIWWIHMKAGKKETFTLDGVGWCQNKYLIAPLWVLAFCLHYWKFGTSLFQTVGSLCSLLYICEFAD